MNADAVRQLVESRTGLTTIWAHQDAPAPARPYASIQITSITRLGPAYVDPTIDQDGNVDVLGQREVVFSIQINEAANNPDPRAALTQAMHLRDVLDLPSVREDLRLDGWAFRAMELLTDISQLDATQWQPRAVFDVRLGTTVELLDELGIIETIAGAGGFDSHTVEFDTRQEP